VTDRDREIVRLAVPALGALVAEPLFVLADTAIVGHLGTPQLAGLAAAATVLTTLVSLCVFLAYATTAAVARQLGAGNMAAALKQGIDGIWLALLLGISFALVGMPTARPLLRLLGASSDVLPYAVTYLTISLLGIPAMLIVLAGSGVLRGLQDTRTPLIVAATTALGNLVLNVVFVYGFGWGIAGSAWGTVIAQTAGAAAYVVVVRRGALQYAVSLRPDRLGVLSSTRAGIPLFVRTVALRAVFVVAIAVAARLGDAELAAYQVSFALWMLLALALDALAIAGQAILGRLLGAGAVPQARAATSRLLRWGLAAGIVSALVVLLAAPLLGLLFSDDPAVRGLLPAALVVVAVLQLVCGPVFLYDGVLIGAGDGRYLAVAATLTTIIFLPAAWAVLTFDAGLVGLWLALGVFLLTRLAFLVARVRGDRWLVPGAVRV
jgi:putative MATE family efflux protein